MRSRDLLSLLVLGWLLASCSLARRRVVDQDGLPVEGALVFSVLPGDMLFGGAKASAFLTDPDGVAPVACAKDVTVIKPGYHTWTDGGLDDRGRSTETDDDEPIVLHRRSGAAQPVVHVSLHEVVFVRPEDEMQPIPLPANLGVELELVDRTRFRVHAKHGGVSESRRFYFAAPSSGTWVATLSQEDDLFFYAQGPTGRIDKVGVTRAHRGSMTVKRKVDGVTRHVPADAVTLMWADVGDQCSAIEPATRPVRIHSIDGDIQLVLGPDPARVADALEDAVVRGDVERRESVGVWLSRLRSK